MKLTATYHDACHLRHAQGVFAQPRKLLSMIPGLKLARSRGGVVLRRPAVITSHNPRCPSGSACKAKHVLATGADAVFTGNVGCILQIAKYIRQAKSGFRVAHPIDVLWSSYSGEPW